MYPHFQVHQAARPIFQDDNTRPHRACIVTDSLAHEGIENLQRPSRSLDMNAIEHFWDNMGRNVCKRNDVVTLDNPVRALVNEWIKLEPRFLRKLVQGMPRQVQELHQRRGGHLFVCLFDLILYVPSTIFQLYRDESSWVEPVLS